MTTFTFNPDSDEEEYEQVHTNLSSNTESPRNDRSGTETGSDWCPKSDILAIVQDPNIQPQPISEVLIQLYRSYEYETRQLMFRIMSRSLSVVCSRRFISSAFVLILIYLHSLLDTISTGEMLRLILNESMNLDSDDLN